MPLKYLFFLVLFVSTNSFGFSKTIVLNVPSTGDGDPVFITGDFCGWRPNCLLVGGTDEVSLSVSVPREMENSLFKLTRGTWESEACDSLGRPLPNMRLGERGIINIPAWCDAPAANGERFIFNYYFESLGKSRRVDVYIPEKFKFEAKKTSVILFLDGQNIFDSNRSAFGVEWRADEAIELLGVEDKILISVDNGGRSRTEEFHYFKKRKKFAEELSLRFMPEMCEKFLLKNTCRNNTIIGSSLGAIFSFTTSYEFPEIFSTSYSLSFPAFAYDDYVFEFVEKVDRDTNSDGLFILILEGLVKIKHMDLILRGFSS